MGFLAGQVEHIHDMEEEALQTEGNTEEFWANAAKDVGSRINSLETMVSESDAQQGIERSQRQFESTNTKLARLGQGLVSVITAAKDEALTNLTNSEGMHSFMKTQLKNDYKTKAKADRQEMVVLESQQQSELETAKSNFATQEAAVETETQEMEASMKSYEESVSKDVCWTWGRWAGVRK